MEAPPTPAPITPTERSGSGKNQTRHRTRLRKACQRCRSRKQRCDGRRPACENCASANAECVPAAQEPMGFYPSRYVQSLEEHIANLERSAEDEARTAGSPLQQLSPTIASFSGDGFVQDLLMQPNAPAPVESNINDLYSILDEDLRGMPDYVNTSSNATDSTPAFMDLDVPVRSGAGYFQAYFELIHPRYPFLDVEECSKAYQQWKAGFIPSQNDIWLKFLVKMVSFHYVRPELIDKSLRQRRIFAIGCILQSSRLDQSAQGLHSDLITQAEASQSIMTNESNSPLLRLQAMLLYTIYALHGDSASRIVHITGVAMRFAVLHGFHQIHDGEAAQNTLNIKAFSCVYAIDRMVSIVLRLPIYPADEWITTPLYESQDDGQFYMPWALDAPGPFAGRLYTYNLKYFSHSCKIRQIQSDIISKAQLIDDQHLATYISHAEERIDVWADMENISLCGQINSEGYSSSTGLIHLANITRVVLYSSISIDVSSSNTDELLQACCDLSRTCRLLETKRQIPKPWLDMIAHFQNAVIILYVIWRRGVQPTREQDQAIRICILSVGIYTDRSANAASFLECLELMASNILVSEPLGFTEVGVRDKLVLLIERVRQTSVAPFVIDLLKEITQT